jgi:hypothetical protein
LEALLYTAPMKSKLLYASGIVSSALFCLFYAIALSGPHRAVPWLLIAYAIFPVALLLMIFAERERRRACAVAVK